LADNALLEGQIRYHTFLAKPQNSEMDKLDRFS